MKVITIGRSEGNDVVINDDDKVSRHHLQIVQFDDGSYQLIDFNSTNGTYINGDRVSGEAVLGEGDFVRIGDTMLPWTTYFEPDFVSQAQEGAEETTAITKDNKEKNAENVQYANASTGPQSSGNNTFAILGFIFAFLVSLLGLIFSIVGIGKAKKMGGKGKGLAVAGLILSVVKIVTEAIIFYVVFFTASVL